MEHHSENHPILFANFAVTSADTDMEARLRPGSLVNFLIQSAIQSADELGFGFGSLRGEKLFWVLSRLSIRIKRPVRWYEEIVVETWPKDVDGLLYLRDFIVRDKSGMIVALATSGWLAVNLETRRPGKIEGIDGIILDRLKSKHALESHPEKLSTVQGSSIIERTITYFDIDLNKHVTSTRYIDWMMDAVPTEFLGKNYPTAISINYIKETQLGDILVLHLNQAEAQTFNYEGQNKLTNQVAFRGKLEFTPPIQDEWKEPGLLNRVIKF